MHYSLCWFLLSMDAIFTKLLFDCGCCDVLKCKFSCVESFIFLPQSQLSGKLQISIWCIYCPRTARKLVRPAYKLVKTVKPHLGYWGRMQFTAAIYDIYNNKKSRIIHQQKIQTLSLNPSPDVRFYQLSL